MKDQDVAPYRQMDLDELAGFVRSCLKRTDDPATECPRSYEEFLEAWRVLRAKADDIPADPSPPPTPLDKAYDKRRRKERFLRGKGAGKEYPDKKQWQQVVRELDLLDREIERMEESGKYDDGPASDPDTPKRVAARTASDVFEEIEDAFAGRPKARRLQWQPGLPGSVSVAAVKRYCAERQRRDPGFRYDTSRIENAYHLEPVGLPWMGPDGFDGYLIFEYPWTKNALMECPEVGNAAYVLHKDWRSWSKMDKQELMAEAGRGGDVTRIEHRGDDWPEKVRQALGFEGP